MKARSIKLGESIVYKGVNKKWNAENSSTKIVHCETNSIADRNNLKIHLTSNSPVFFANRRNIIKVNIPHPTKICTILSLCTILILQGDYRCIVSILLMPSSSTRPFLSDLHHNYYIF